MEVLKVFHMNKGEGENSYAKNSNVQSDIISIVKPLTQKTLLDFFTTTARRSSSSALKAGNGNRKTSLGIADLGCSSGPNTWKAVSQIIDMVYTATLSGGAGRPEELMIYLNDLPGNDFNYVFASLPSFLKKQRDEKGETFGPCFVAGVPGSFHDRLFPARSLHFVHSASSLHWLSKVPPELNATRYGPHLNKGKVNVSKCSPKAVLDAYSNQFKQDFFDFLRSRSVEVVAEGRMVLTFMGRRLADPTTEEDNYLHWDILASCLKTMVSKGLVEEDKVDSFEVPYYASSPHELEEVVDSEGSFEIDQLGVFDFHWDGTLFTTAETTPMMDCEENNWMRSRRVEKIAKAHRAILEGLFKHHFGGDEAVIDELFLRYSEMLECCFSEREPKFTNLAMSLKRKNDGLVNNYA